MSFLKEITSITKKARDSKFMVEELEHDANVLLKIAEKKIKNEIRREAEAGGDSITYNLVYNLVNKIDFMSRWGVEELMFKRIIPEFVTVQERLYDNTLTIQTRGPFEGFEISHSPGAITVSWKSQLDLSSEFKTPTKAPQSPAKTPQAPVKAPQPPTKSPTPSELASILLDLYLGSLPELKTPV